MCAKKTREQKKGGNHTHTRSLFFFFFFSHQAAGKGGSATGRFANGTVTWTTQPAVLMDMGMGQWLNGTAASGECYNQMAMDFDGLVLLPPGSAICVGAATAASSATYWTSIVYAELPTITY